jgi:DNA helicase-2/ATP-dependent DNA helicase PcrA
MIGLSLPDALELAMEPTRPATASAASPPLNAEQRAAVRHRGGPMRILAGAGTGKTQTLTARFLDLVERGDAAPHEILTLTFTTKAAEEMRGRIVPRLSGAGRELWIQTFHAFCLRVIKEWRRLEGDPLPVIVGDDQQRHLAAEAARTLAEETLLIHRGEGGRARLANDLVTLANRAKDHLLGPEAFAAHVARDAPESGRLRELAAGFTAYQQLLRARGFTDYGDLALEVVERLRRDQATRDALRRRFPYVLVDEFQDTNYAQFALIRQLAPARGELCVVGDPNQSIYAFRGGRPDYIERFADFYPGMQTFELTTNFRSGAPILETANRLIEHNPEASHFALVPADPTRPATVTVTEVGSAELEAELIARRILERVRRPDRACRFGEIAVLARSLRRSQETLTRAFEANGIPYRTARAEASVPAEVVQDVLAALRLAIGPTSWRDAVRLAVARGAEPAAVRSLEARCDADHLDLLATTDTGELVGEGERCALGVVHEVSKEAAAIDRASLPRLLYGAMLLAGHLRDDVAPPVALFLRQIARQAEELAATGADAATLLEHLTAGHGADEDAAPDDPHGVQLMTVHAAKGLEWRVVFLTGLAEGLFPLPMRLDRDFDIATIVDRAGDERELTEATREAAYLQEERRLVYVALTRAQEEVHVTAPRAMDGAPLAPALFLAEMGNAVETISSWAEGEATPSTRAGIARHLRHRQRRALSAALDDPDATEQLASLLLAEWAASGSTLGAMPARLRGVPAPYDDSTSIRFSFSALDTYEKCHRQYLYQSVLGLEREEEATALVMGSAVHAALRRLNEQWRETGEPPGPVAVETALSVVWPEIGFDCLAQSRQLRQRAGSMLRRYYAWEAERADRRVPIEVERGFGHPFDRHTVTGRVDLVVRDPDGAAEIIDFKVSKPGSVTKPGESLQLYLYHHVWGIEHPGEWPRVSIYALRHEEDKGFATAPAWDAKQVKRIDHDELSLEPLRLRTMDLLAGIAGNDFRPMATPDQCARCRCRWLCPEG